MQSRTGRRRAPQSQRIGTAFRRSTDVAKSARQVRPTHWRPAPRRIRTTKASSLSSWPDRPRSRHTQCDPETCCRRRSKPQAVWAPVPIIGRWRSRCRLQDGRALVLSTRTRHRRDFQETAAAKFENRILPFDVVVPSRARVSAANMVSAACKCNEINERFDNPAH
jgi:hypothetical protein